MGIFRTRWEAEYEGHNLVVARSEWTKGFRLEWDGEVVAKRGWSLIGLGEIQGSVEVDAKPVEVKVVIGWGGIDGKCLILVDGREIPVRKVG